jgi:hypothetical protein
VILRREKPRRFVMIEKITVGLPDCIHVMMELTKSIGEIVKMQQRMIIIMIQMIIMEKVVMTWDIMMDISKQTYSHCSGITTYDEYYVGFRIGCTSACNTIDVCENATGE